MLRSCLNATHDVEEASISPQGIEEPGQIHFPMEQAGSNLLLNVKDHICLAAYKFHYYTFSQSGV